MEACLTLWPSIKDGGRGEGGINCYIRFTDSGRGNRTAFAV